MSTQKLRLVLNGETIERTITGGTPAELAAAVHRHARGQLGARRVDIHLAPDTLTGTVRRAGADVGTFTLSTKAMAQPTDQPAETDGIRWGWTLDDIDRIAWGVAASDRWHRGTPVAERHDHAEYGILVHLLDAPTPPAEYDLYRAGLAEISRAVHAEFRFAGRDDTADANGEFGYVPRVAAYWNTPRSPIEDSVVERIALHQAWKVLTVRQREALAVLATCGDYQRAAEALGLKLGALDGRLDKGRRRFVAAWYEHETPPRRRQRDRRVATRSGLDSLGRKRMTVSQLDQARARQHAGELLRDIAPDYGITRQALGALLRGDRKPAPDTELEAAA